MISVFNKKSAFEHTQAVDSATLLLIMDEASFVKVFYQFIFVKIMRGYEKLNCINSSKNDGLDIFGVVWACIFWGCRTRIGFYYSTFASFYAQSPVLKLQICMPPRFCAN